MRRKSLMDSSLEEIRHCKQFAAPKDSLFGLGLAFWTGFEMNHCCNVQQLRMNPNTHSIRPLNQLFRVLRQLPCMQRPAHAPSHTRMKGSTLLETHKQWHSSVCYHNYTYILHRLPFTFFIFVVSQNKMEHEKDPHKTIIIPIYPHHYVHPSLVISITN